MQQLHANVLINGFEKKTLLGIRLVSRYAMCGNLSNARLVFDITYAPSKFCGTLQLESTLRMISW